MVDVHEGTWTVAPAQVRVDIRPESFNIDRNGAVSLVIYGSDAVDLFLSGRSLRTLIASIGLG